MFVLHRIIILMLPVFFWIVLYDFLRVSELRRGKISKISSLLVVLAEWLHMFFLCLAVVCISILSVEAKLILFGGSGIPFCWLYIASLLVPSTQIPIFGMWDFKASSFNDDVVYLNWGLVYGWFLLDDCR